MTHLSLPAILWLLCAAMVAFIGWRAARLWLEKRLVRRGEARKINGADNQPQT
jgi:HAMP domain-containing protein